MRRYARAAGYAWKRCRRSLRPQRDPAAFAACQARLDELHRAEACGAGNVVYVDECRFSRHAPVPYAWQRRGHPPVEVPAVRGSGGYSVLGFWQAGGPGQPLHAYRRAGALTADLFVLAVHEFCQTLTQPTVLVLDNASIHKAHVVRACHADWAAKGLTLLFLPPYSPELNKIEYSGTAASTTGSAPKTTKPTKPCSNEWNTCLKESAQIIRLLLRDYLTHPHENASIQNQH